MDYLSPEQKGKFLETFKYTRLEYLSLDNYGLRDEHALIIADILKTNHRLKTLKICSSSFTHEIAPSLSEALKMNDNLQVLKMNWNVGLTDPRIERFS